MVMSKQYLVERSLGDSDEIKVEEYTLEKSKH